MTINHTNNRLSQQDQTSQRAQAPEDSSDSLQGLENTTSESTRVSQGASMAEANNDRHLNSATTHTMPSEQESIQIGSLPERARTKVINLLEAKNILLQRIQAASSGLVLMMFQNTLNPEMLQTIQSDRDMLNKINARISAIAAAGISAKNAPSQEPTSNQVTMDELTEWLSDDTFEEEEQAMNTSESSMLLRCDVAKNINDHFANILWEKGQPVTVPGLNSDDNALDVLKNIQELIANFKPTSSSVDIDATSDIKSNLLIEAAKKRDQKAFDVLSKLISKPAQASILLAAQLGHIDDIKSLQNMGLELNFHVNKQSLGLIAVQIGNLDTIEYFFQEGVDFTEQDEQTTITPIHRAIMNNNIEVMTSLLDHGVSVENSNNKCWTPVMVAAVNDNATVINLLHERGADLNAQDHKGETPTASAVRGNAKTALRTLIQHDANIKTPNYYGITPLHTAAAEGYTEILKLLCENTADINIAANDGSTPLCLAAEKGKLAAIQALIALDADVEKSLDSRATPVLLAAQNGHTAAVEALVFAGADIQARSDRGSSPLFCAAQNGHRDVVEFLLSKGATVNVTTNDGETPISTAQTHDHTEIVALLQEKARSEQSDTIATSMGKS